MFGFSILTILLLPQQGEGYKIISGLGMYKIDKQKLYFHQINEKYYYSNILNIVYNFNNSNYFQGQKMAEHNENIIVKTVSLTSMEQCVYYLSMLASLSFLISVCAHVFITKYLLVYITHHIEITGN